MKPYRQNLVKVFDKIIDWNSDALKWTLHTSTYAPNFDTHVFQSDLTNELGTAGGYTAGGLAIASPTMTYTAANSWSVVRANTTAYALGDVFRPSATNGFLYNVVTAGTSAGAPPTFPTVVGTTVADGTAVIECVGAGIMVLGCSDPLWAAATFGPCRYAVLSDTTPGSAATNPLIGLVDFVSDKTGGGGNFVVNLHTALRAMHFFMP